MPRPSRSYPNDPRLIAIGNAIRAMRKAKGVSQELLASMSAVDRAFMGGIERGNQNPSLVAYLRIAEGLDTKLSEVLRNAGF